jgi:PAT family beta-lactamase induction signal transducer AmpG
MGILDPGESIAPMAACAVAIAFLSASQDIVFDAYRSDLLDESERGAGAAVSVLGYRLAMLVSGGLAMVLADTVLGWAGTYRLMAALFVLLFIGTLFIPRVPEPHGERTPVGRELRGFAAMLLAGLACFLILRQAPW